MKKYLLYCIQEAVEDKYIASLVDKYTKLLNNNVPIVMQYFFITAEKLDLKK